MPDNSFDIVSKIELPEVSNAVQQALKEIQQRYDLKTSNSNIELQEKENKILLQSRDEFSLKAVTEILEQKLVKRNVPLKGLVYGDHHPRRRIHRAPGDQPATGHPHREGARDRASVIKDSKKKVQASIQGDLVRISGKDRDTLQEVMRSCARAISASTCSSPTTGPTESLWPAKSNRCFWTVPPDAWRPAGGA